MFYNFKHLTLSLIDPNIFGSTASVQSLQMYHKVLKIACSPLVIYVSRNFLFGFIATFITITCFVMLGIKKIHTFQWLAQPFSSGVLRYQKMGESLESKPD